MSPKVLQVHELLPLPRVLPTLGEIALDNWQCVAELVDNAIDGFRPLAAPGLPKSQNLEVDIYLSQKGNNGKPEVVVVDNGPGMTVPKMCSAVRAGYTSRTDKNAGYLGLYGMGLNVAMARLGARTEIWTKQGDSRPSALVVDFKEMERAGKFQFPQIRVDPAETPWRIAKRGGNFTAIRVTELRDNAVELCNQPDSVAALCSQLGDVYSSILIRGVPIPLTLTVNGIRAAGHRHNVWRIHDAGPKREARIEIDEAVSGGHRVHGWIGVQRFSDLADYGIDFIWNGRKIESRNKELFSCVVDGADPLEYPIDKPRRGGRIVGEIHLDHCSVPFTKTRFYREDPAWNEMIQVVRGGFQSPMRPNIANARKLPKNNSHLATLYGRFRRNDAHDTRDEESWKALLAFPDNEHAKKLAMRPKPLTDDEWLVELNKDIKKEIRKPRKARKASVRPLVPGPAPVSPARKPRPPMGARKHLNLDGLPSESALVQDPFVKAALAEILSSLDEEKTPIAFSLTIRAVVEVALLCALEKKSPKIWKEIKDKNMGIHGIIQKLDGRFNQKERIFEDPSLNEAVRGFVQRGMSDKIGLFLNNLAHGHTLADKESAKALAIRVAKLLHRLLG